MPRGNPPRSLRAGLSSAWLCALCGQQARTASVELSKAPDVCAQDIAGHTLALLLAATRQIVQAHESVRQGRAPKGDVPYRWRDGVPERAAEVDFLVVCASGGTGIIVNQGTCGGLQRLLSGTRAWGTTTRSSMDRRETYLRSCGSHSRPRHLAPVEAPARAASTSRSSDAAFGRSGNTSLP